MVNKVTFFCFRGSDSPNRPPGSAPGSIAPKQDKVRVSEVWNSCVQGTLSNLLPKLTAEEKHCMHFGFCCIAHFNVATV